MHTPDIHPYNGAAPGKLKKTPYSKRNIAKIKSLLLFFQLKKLNNTKLNKITPSPTEDKEQPIHTYIPRHTNAYIDKYIYKHTYIPTYTRAHRIHIHNGAALKKLYSPLC